RRCGHSRRHDLAGHVSVLFAKGAERLRGSTPEAAPFDGPYCKRPRTACGEAFACDRTATPACCRICAFVRFAVSAAKSASWMRLREASRFSTTVLRFAMVDSKRFWIAPRSLRTELTAVREASMRRIVSLAAST